MEPKESELSTGLKAIAKKMTATMFSGVAHGSGFSTGIGGILRPNLPTFGTVLQNENNDEKLMVISQSDVLGIESPTMMYTMDMKTGLRRIINVSVWEEVPIEKP